MTQSLTLNTDTFCSNHCNPRQIVGYAIVTVLAMAAITVGIYFQVQSINTIPAWCLISGGAALPVGFLIRVIFSSKKEFPPQLPEKPASSSTLTIEPKNETPSVATHASIVPEAPLSSSSLPFEPKIETPSVTPPTSIVPEKPSGIPSKCIIIGSEDIDAALVHPLNVLGKGHGLEFEFLKTKDLEKSKDDLTERKAKREAALIYFEAFSSRGDNLKGIKSFFKEYGVDNIIVMGFPEKKLSNFWNEANKIAQNRAHLVEAIFEWNPVKWKIEFINTAELLQNIKIQLHAIYSKNE